ncbi:hypothetical protein BDP27DRAFT_1421927 [Rhodocollybia butyracea]|uniref:Uncharacterized protein n=1 Tax=Rhodocollybia butyracea TaxID=206335 RepID=A0A9P5PUT8_9AGAR|nr:hypothetical protein BDP27DRAFT_1421927 [Rhodocollybia butyracea]
MLLPHNWLAFVPLAVLILPVCAAPTPPAPAASLEPEPKSPTRYKVTIVDMDGDKDEKPVPSSTHTLIKNLIFDMGEGLKDGKGAKGKEVIPQYKVTEAKEPAKTITVYFKLSGGNFCPETQKCYGYLVVTMGTLKTNMVVGAVITKTGENSFAVVDRIPVREIRYMASKYIHQLEYYKFLIMFAPIKEWAKAMAEGTAVVAVSEVLWGISVLNKPKAPRAKPKPANTVPRPQLQVPHSHLQVARPLHAKSGAEPDSPPYPWRRLPPLPAVRGAGRRPVRETLARIAPLRGAGPPSDAQETGDRMLPGASSGHPQ